MNPNSKGKSQSLLVVTFLFLKTFNQRWLLEVSDTIYSEIDSSNYTRNFGRYFGPLHSRQPAQH